jgi:cobaltochelatase CobS
MNPDYSGTHRLNDAFMDRFIVVDMDYPKAKEEVDILVKRNPNLKDKSLLTHMVQVAKKVREAYRKGDVISTFSTRKLLFWAEMCEVFPAAKAFKYSVLNKLVKEDVSIVKDAAATVFPDAEFRNTLEMKD